jgi:branched-subunit amino acid aminotransferase/4-amino-4-deoxychorismate lyase
MNEIIFYNHKFLSADTPCIQAHDRGFTLGDGVFETILSYNYKMPFFEQHWQRLIESLNLLAIELPNNYNKNYVISIINKLLNKNNIKPHVWQGIKIIVTRGTGSRSLEPKRDYKYEANLIITCFATTKPELNHKTLRLDIKHQINLYSILPKIKSLNYLDKIIAKQQAMANNYDDALLINQNFNICETTTSNVFFITNDKNVITAKITDGILPGITRQFVINTLIESNYHITETSINMLDLLQNKYNICAAFMTNSIMGINTIHLINDLNLELIQQDHEIIEWLYNKLLKNYL